MIAARTRRQVWGAARRWTAAASLAFLALGVLTYTASANFSGSAPSTHDSDTGDMALTVGDAGSFENRLSVSSNDLAPGDTVQRQVVLGVANVEQTMSALTMTTTAGTATGGDTPPSFITDAEHGLQLWISACTEAWTEAGTDPSYTYTCPGTMHDVLGSDAAPLPVLQSEVPLAHVSVDDGAENYLRVQLELPLSAPSSMKGQSETITFTFRGQQRAGDRR